MPPAHDPAIVVNRASDGAAFIDQCVELGYTAVDEQERADDLVGVKRRDVKLCRCRPADDDIIIADVRRAALAHLSAERGQLDHLTIDPEERLGEQPVND